MTGPARNWDDLGPRLLTATALILVGAVALILGGWILLIITAVLCALMTRELVQMISPAQGRLGDALALLAGVAIVSLYTDLNFLIFAGPVVVLGTALLHNGRLTYLIYATLILTGCFAVIFTRNFFGLHVIWLVSVVVASDVAGYLVGRSVGGPKFWPRVSPKKTWSGTVGGWIGAALVGVVFAPSLGYGVIFGGVVLAFAAQMGDIGESAIKRAAGVKDSSSILPGHGGILDRFDGMIAAFSVWLVTAPLFVQVPAGF